MKLATFEIPTTAGPLRRLGAAADGWMVDLAATRCRRTTRVIPTRSSGRRRAFRCRRIARSSTSSWSSAMVIGRRGRNIAKAEADATSPATRSGTTSAPAISRCAKGRSAWVRARRRTSTPATPSGPYLVTADELDVSSLRMIARVNGETWTDSTSAGRQFSFADLIVHVSQSETIHPGEFWGSGTVTGGSGLELGRWLKPGTSSSSRIEGIGVLRNRVIR